MHFKIYYLKLTRLDLVGPTGLGMDQYRGMSLKTAFRCVCVCLDGPNRDQVLKLLATLSLRTDDYEGSSRCPGHFT